MTPILLQENRILFKAEEDSELWRDYLLYVDDAVIDGCFNMVECTLKFLLQQTDTRLQLAPLFEAKLELHAPDMIFTYVRLKVL